MNMLKKLKSKKAKLEIDKLKINGYQIIPEHNYFQFCARVK